MLVKVVFFDLGETLVTKERKWVAGAKDVLVFLQNRNLHLGIISNTGQMTDAEIVKALPPDFDFSVFEKEFIIFSGNVGIEKPDQKIFQLAVDKSGISAGECLFITENAIDALVAQRVGIKTLRLLPPPISDLAETGNYLIKAGLVV